MSTKQIQIDVPDVQAAIYRVALSLDAFLLNGLQYGVLSNTIFPGFLQKTASNLLRDLTSLEGQVPQKPRDSQPQGTEVVAALRSKCEHMIDLVTRLSSFRTLPLEQVRATVSQILLLREQCVQLIQELEGCFRTSEPFYQTRPSNSAATMTDFLGRLEDTVTKEWAASNTNLSEIVANHSPQVPPIFCPRCGAVLQMWEKEVQQQICPLCHARITR
jgi:hypothetical protein